jgi:hypothetical protein
MQRSRILTIGLSLLLAGCSSDSTGPTTPSYENIAATYAGVLAGNAQGIILTGSFSLTIQQSAGDLTGSYSMTGNLNDGVDIVQVQGSGSLTGTISSGQNPSVNITLRTGLCPNYQATFSGAYDSTNSKLTLSGPIDILDGSCTVVIRYVSTLILIR